MNLHPRSVDAFSSPFGANGTVAVAPWGDVHVATVDSKIRVASFAPDGSLIGAGVYGRTGAGNPQGHPAPAIAFGPSGDVVLAGGFSNVDLDLPPMPLANAFAWSTDLFFARSPPSVDRSSEPPAATPPSSPTLVHAAEPFGIAVNSSNVYWLEFTSANQVDLYKCASAGCGAGEPAKLATLSARMTGLAAGAAGVFAAGLDTTSGTALRCPGDVCVADTLGFAPIAVSLGQSSLAFASYGADYSHLDLSSCPLTGCSGAPTTVTSNLAVSYANAYGLFSSADATTLGLVSCPVTGCGTNPPQGTEWLTLLPTLDLAADAMHVYTHGNDHIDACSFPACAPSAKLVAAGLGNVTLAFTVPLTPRIATDGVSVYFFDFGPSAPWVPATGVRLLKCPASGCPASGPEVLWMSPPWPSNLGQTPLALAVDGSNVFFAALQPNLSSSLVKLPK